MRIAPFLVAGMLVLALAGCVPSGGHGTASPSASATPVFSSDEEALKAAEAAYAAYEVAVDRSLQSSSTDGLEDVATGDALKTALSSVDSFKKAGQVQRGSSSINKVRAADLGPLTDSAIGDEPAQVYACLDVSMVQIVDSDGKLVSASNRQTVFPTLVSLTWSSAKKTLLVSEESVWDGSNFCA